MDFWFGFLIFVVIIAVISGGATSKSNKNSSSSRKNSSNYYRNPYYRKNSSSYYRNSYSTNKPQAKIIETKGESRSFITKIQSGDVSSITPEEKGAIGEEIIKLIIGENINNGLYSIHNLIIEDEKGHTSQIDHIVINKNGVWVLETKYWSGMLYGDHEEQEWVQMLDNGQVEHVYNPLKQNWKHLLNIKKYLGEEIPMHSLVVVLDANISNIMSKYVITHKDLLKCLWENQEKTISVEEMNRCYSILQNIKSSQVTDSEHVDNVKAIRNNIKEEKCPSCGATLVRTEGQYGAFYHCQTYPKCKFRISEYKFKKLIKKEK